MKIQPTISPAAPPPSKQRGAQAVPTRDDGDGDKADVQVAFSPAARILSAGVPEDQADTEKVLRLRDQIAAGTYEIDDQALAKALVEKELKWRP